MPDTLESIRIRPMEPADLPRLVEDSEAATGMFTAAGIALPPDDTASTVAHAERVFVADRPGAAAAVGFAAVVEVDGAAHLEEVAVHCDHGRRGVGRALLEAVCTGAAEQGYRRLTLTTFRDIAWNAPWYARCGFTEMAEGEWGPGLRALWRAEAGIRVAPRLVMRRDLGGSRPVPPVPRL